MQTNYERYCKMSSLAQIGWWEADFLAGHYVCSDFLCDLLGLEGDTISFMDFQNLIREDYREQIVQEFRANANIHKDFYEQTFPICLKMVKFGCIPVWLFVRKVPEPMEVTNLLASSSVLRRLKKWNRKYPPACKRPVTPAKLYITVFASLPP